MARENSSSSPFWKHFFFHYTTAEEEKEALHFPNNTCENRTPALLKFSYPWQALSGLLFICPETLALFICPLWSPQLWQLEIKPLSAFEVRCKEQIELNKMGEGKFRAGQNVFLWILKSLVWMFPSGTSVKEAWLPPMAPIDYLNVSAHEPIHVNMRLECPGFYSSLSANLQMKITYKRLRPFQGRYKGSAVTQRLKPWILVVSL